MRLLLCALLLSCGGAEAQPDAGPPDSGPPPHLDAGTPDAGPSFFTATMKYQKATGYECPGETLVTCTKALRLEERRRADITLAYSHCAFSGASELVTIDCTNNCTRYEANCGAQFPSAWNCTAPFDTDPTSCEWHFP